MNIIILLPNWKKSFCEIKEAWNDLKNNWRQLWKGKEFRRYY